MVTVFPPAKHDDLSSPRMVSLCFLAAVNNQNLDEKKMKKKQQSRGESSVCVRMLVQLKGRVIFVAERLTHGQQGQFLLEGIFLSSIFVPLNPFIF